MRMKNIDISQCGGAENNVFEAALQRVSGKTWILKADVEFRCQRSFGSS